MHPTLTTVLHQYECHTSHVTRHASHVTRHASHRMICAQRVTCHTSSVAHRMLSRVTRHTSHVTRHTSHITRTANHRRDRTRPRWAPLIHAAVASEGKTQTSEKTEPDPSNNSDLSVQHIGDNTAPRCISAQSVTIIQCGTWKSIRTHRVS